MSKSYLLIALAATGKGESSFQIFEDAKSIARNAGVIRKWAELECNGINGQWSDADQAKADRRTKKAKEAIAKKIAGYRGEALYENTDPRGALVTIITHDHLGRFYKWSY